MSYTEKHSRLPFFKTNVTAGTIATKLIYGKSRTTSQPLNNDSEFVPDLTTLNSIASQTTLSINDVDNMYEVLPDLIQAEKIHISSILAPTDLRNTDLTWNVPDSILSPALTQDLTEKCKYHFETNVLIKKLATEAAKDALYRTGAYPIIIVSESAVDDLVNGRDKIGLESLHELDIIDDNNNFKSCGFLGKGLTLDNGNSTARNYKNKNVGALESLDSDEASLDADDQLLCFDKNVLITDNIDLLKAPILHETARQQRLSAKAGDKIKDLIKRHVVKNIPETQDTKYDGLISTNTPRDDVEILVMDGELVISNKTPGLESEEIPTTEEQRMSFGEVGTMLYRTINYSNKPALMLKTYDQTSRPMIGHPMVIKAPADSIIPVHIPNDPKTHVGYYILLDEFGNFLSNSKESNYYREINSTRLNNSQKDAASAILEQVKRATTGIDCDNRNSFLLMSEIYTRATEMDFIRRLANGINGKNVELSNTNELMRIMFARSLSGRNTQVLYVNAENVVYWAYNYNKYGIGRSLTDRTKMIAGIRATLLFSNTMGAINNSSNNRHIKIKLDAEDPEPEASVEYIMTEMAKLQGNAFPLATTHPMDIIDGIRRARQNVSVEGNELYPDVTVDVEDKASTRVMVDTELMETTKDLHYLGLGLIPEIIDSSRDVNFAIEAIQNNLMYSKQIAMDQEITEYHMNDYIKKYTLNSGSLMKDLIGIIVNHSKNKESSVLATEVDAKNATVNSVQLETVTDTIMYFLNNLKVSLPSPPSNKIDENLTRYTSYKNYITEVLEASVDDTLNAELFGDDEAAKKMLDSVKNALLREFMAENGMFTEINDFFSKNPDSTKVASIEEHFKNITNFTLAYKNMVEAIVKKNDLPTVNDEAGDGTTADYGSSDFDLPDEDYSLDDTEEQQEIETVLDEDNSLEEDNIAEDTVKEEDVSNDTDLPLD